MKKILVIGLVLILVFSAFVFAQKGICGNKKDVKCCKLCVLCDIDANITVTNTDEGVLVTIKGKSKEDVKKIQENIKECCCFNKNSNKK